MTEGLAINRRWILVLNNGIIIIDWGNGILQDIHTGEFLSGLSLVGSHAILDEQLDWLKRTATITGYDESNVYFTSLPEYPKDTLE